MNIGQVYKSGKSMIMDIWGYGIPSQSFLLLPFKGEKKPGSPHYQIFMHDSDGQLRQVGAIWNQLSKDGQTAFKSATIESPIFYMGKLHMAIFEVKEPKVITRKEKEDKNILFNVVWTPPKKRENSFGSNEYAPQQAPHPQGDVYVPDESEFRGGGQVPEDDEIPF